MQLIKFHLRCVIKAHGGKEKVVTPLAAAQQAEYLKNHH